MNIPFFPVKYPASESPISHEQAANTPKYVRHPLHLEQDRTCPVQYAAMILLKFSSIISMYMDKACKSNWKGIKYVYESKIH